MITITLRAPHAWIGEVTLSDKTRHIVADGLLTADLTTAQIEELEAMGFVRDGAVSP